MEINTTATDLKPVGGFLGLVRECLANGLILSNADMRLKKALDGALQRTRDLCLEEDPTLEDCKIAKQCLAEVLYCHFDEILFPVYAPREFIQGLLTRTEKYPDFEVSAR